MMNVLGKLHLLVGILASVLLMAQAVIGIMMYVNGSGNEPMNGQAMMDRPVDRNTTESDATGESSKSSTAATDDSTAETTPNDTQSSMADGPNGSGTPGEMPSGGGFQGRDSFACKFINFYQGVGGLAASIIIFVIGSTGLVTSMMSRKTAA
ncbi:hypothetical protein QUF94_00845 [Peribacillus sp. NJ4]|nr:hypothetical protein [Peribacillus sp. NJ4]